MSNPFETLGKEPENQEWELVEDSILACQKCSKIVKKGRYYDKENLLVWECICGHVSKVYITL